MNIHSLLDIVSISVGSCFMPKYFRNGLEAESLEKHKDSIKLNIQFSDAEGDYRVGVESLAGELSSLFRIAQWKGSNFPVIIYHHGAAELPFDFGFNRIFPYKKMKIDANLILIRAPYHTSMKEYKAGMAKLNNFMAMLAASIELIESLVSYIKEKNEHSIVVSGTSLGGYISNFHHIYHNSASHYVPLLAGVNIYDTLFESIYSKSVTKLESKDKDRLNELMNFTDQFASVTSENVYPLLGRYDQLVRYKIQKKSYGSCQIKSINRSHVTGSLSANKLREHIFSII